MGFFIDECAPKTLGDVFFHKDIYEILRRMAQSKSIPHIIFHGERGAGKRTMVNIFLDMIYNGESNKLITNKYKISGSGSKVKEEMVQSSNHHIIIKPTKTNFDKYLVHNIIKRYAGARPTTMESEMTDVGFRVIQISNLDALSQSAQNSLRRMIEVNSNNCRFIMWANNLSNVIEPLQSRGICIRVPRPSDRELHTYLTIIANNYDIDNVTHEDLYKIVKYSKNDIKTALWCLQSLKYNYDYETNYDRSIVNIVDLICKCDLGLIDDTLSEKKNEKGDRVVLHSGIRDRLFNLMITNYDPCKILRSITMELLKRDELTEEVKMNIVMLTSKTEYDMKRGRREIIHYDSYVTSIIKMIYHMKND